MCAKKPKRSGHHAATSDTGDPWLNLWAAVLKQAVEEAREGNKEAAIWLWATDPQVAEIARIPTLGKAKKKVRIDKYGN